MVSKSLPFPQACFLADIEQLVEEWSRCDHEIICAAVTQWRAHLHACVKVDGGHFEHFL